MKVNLKSRNGYTLVELLAAIVVVVAISSVITNVITSSLRGANKVNIIENIRQTGNFILSQMTKDITYAQMFDGVNTGFNPVLDAVGPNPPHYTVCPALVPVPTPLFTEMTVKTAGGNIVKYECSGDSGAVPITVPILRKTVARVGATPEPTISLIGSSSPIVLKSCSLNCNQDSGVPIIEVKFKIGPKNSPGLAENNDNSAVIFKTSITMRNYR